VKVALFDFCETLVDFQTADAYVHYVREITGNKRMLRLNIVHSILIRIKVIRLLSLIFRYSSINKRIILYQLKGFTQQELDRYAEQYYANRIKPKLNKLLIKELILKQQEGYTIVLVSGGYDIYLKFFSVEFNIDGLISTKIRFKNNKCTGKFDGIDCLWDNKITLLENYFKGQQIDKQKSYAYSDSKSDLPLLRWVNNGVVVRKDMPSKWALKEGFCQIVWK